MIFFQEDCKRIAKKVFSKVNTILQALIKWCVCLYSVIWLIHDTGFPVRGFPRQLTLEWAAISTSRGLPYPGLSPSTASPALAEHITHRWTHLESFTLNMVANIITSVTTGDILRKTCCLLWPSVGLKIRGRELLQVETHKDSFLLLAGGFVLNIVSMHNQLPYFSMLVKTFVAASMEVPSKPKSPCPLPVP